MSDDEHRIAFAFEAPHRSVERRAALIVQIGVGFVQNQKHRIAKKGPRQTDALCLAVPLADCAKACGPNAKSIATNSVVNRAVIRPIMPWDLQHERRRKLNRSSLPSPETNEAPEGAPFIQLQCASDALRFSQRAAAAAYFLRNLSTRPAVSRIFCLPV